LTPVSWIVAHLNYQITDSNIDNNSPKTLIVLILVNSVLSPWPAFNFAIQDFHRYSIFFSGALLLLRLLHAFEEPLHSHRRSGDPANDGGVLVGLLSPGGCPGGGQSYPVS
jgi:hypothetical protein